MFKISIVKYEKMINEIVDALNLRDYDFDAIHDHIESIDMNFNVHENEQQIIDDLIIDNIESLYDAINDLIEILRVNRYFEMKYENNQFVFTKNDDDEFVANNTIYHENDNTIEYVEIERVTIEQIDEFESNM